MSPRAIRPAMQISLVIGLVLLLVGVGVVDRALAKPATAVVAAQPVSAVPAAQVESSAWYCAGGTGIAGSAAVATLDLANTTARRATGTMTVVTDAGATVTRAISLAARAQETISPSSVTPANWVATGLQFEGGGVLVSQSVDGPDGWSAAPCARTTSADWYFASGSTEPGNTLNLALFNPTAATAVVDLSFITPQGVLEPQLFEGVVVRAGGLVVEQIGAYVQDQSSVSTVVQVGTGRVVADETQVVSVGGVRGLSLRLGVPRLADTWVLPRSVDPVGGSTTLSIFNPTLRPERLVATVRLPSGPVTPFAKTLLGQSTWVLAADAQVRIPKGVSYSMVVRASGGAGVVVDRTVAAPTGAPAPQFGAQTAVPGTAAGAREIVAAPGTRATPAVPGAGATGLGLLNPGTGRVAVTVSSAPTPGAGALVLRRLVLAPGSSALIGARVLRGLERRPLLVSASGPVAAMVDLGPVGSPGVAGLPAVPIEAG
jgi:hypothetical protein